MPARPHRVESSLQTCGPASRDYIEKTRAFWQPHSPQPLSHEDAREMAENLVGFFSVLREWTIRERKERAAFARAAQVTCRKRASIDASPAQEPSN